MIFLGLIVAAAAVGVGIGVVLDNTTDAQLSLLDQTIPGLTSTWHVFLAGAVVAVVFMSGMIVAMLGIGRSVRVRRELRNLRDEHEEELTTLEMEKRHLQRELARVRREQPPAPAQRPAQPQPQTQVQAPAHASGPPPRPGVQGSRVASSPFFDSAG
ncbi:MAG TPA: hypothetical protein VFU43_03290 [Streptosporangiaceae bacterium]|nr:hypothetical protein [Streptosporangiaceae bacterium]